MKHEHKKETRVARGQRGFTLIEICCVMAVLAIIAAMAVGRYNRATSAANERAAVAELRVVGEAESNYRFTNGDWAGYAHLGKLADMQMIDMPLGGGGGAATTSYRSGYDFQSTVFSSPPGFIISAIPHHTSPLIYTGAHRFAVDDSGLLYSDEGNLDRHYSTKAELTAGTSGAFKP
jgi:prepilin-type N-terminal cleavage/methylation domain-containing protein